MAAPELAIQLGAEVNESYPSDPGVEGHPDVDGFLLRSQIRGGG
jgi:hypothetical protein